MTPNLSKPMIDSSEHSLLIASAPTDSAFSLPKTPTLEDQKRTKTNSSNLLITIKIDGVPYKSIEGPSSSTSLSRNSECGDSEMEDLIDENEI